MYILRFASNSEHYDYFPFDIEVKHFTFVPVAFHFDIEHTGKTDKEEERERERERDGEGTLPVIACPTGWLRLFHGSPGFAFHYTE